MNFSANATTVECQAEYPFSHLPFNQAESFFSHPLPRIFIGGLSAE